jgi:hypothetical protein
MSMETIKYMYMDYKASQIILFIIIDSHDYLYAV